MAISGTTEIETTKESKISKIVKEDILRITMENEGQKVSLKSLKSEIRASKLFVRNAIKELEKENLVWTKGDFVSLTKKGQDKAKIILQKHFVLEDYFKETMSGRKAHQAAHILEHYVSSKVINNLDRLSTLRGDGVPLTQVELDKESLIVDIGLPKLKIFEKIVSMGISLGERIQVTHAIPNGIIVSMENRKFALGSDIAEKIKVLQYEAT